LVHENSSFREEAGLSANSVDHINAAIFSGTNRQVPQPPESVLKARRNQSATGTQIFIVIGFLHSVIRVEVISYRKMTRG